MSVSILLTRLINTSIQAGRKCAEKGIQLGRSQASSFARGKIIFTLLILIKLFYSIILQSINYKTTLRKSYYIGELDYNYSVRSGSIRSLSNLEMF